MLDMILTFLMSVDIPVFKNKIKEVGREKIDMDFISEMYNEYDWEDWMKKSFQDELTYKKFVEVDKKGNLYITEIGKEFKRNGGYANSDKIQIQESTIREKTIESFKYGKWGFYMSIIAIIISIIALLLQK